MSTSSEQRVEILASEKKHARFVLFLVLVGVSFIFLILDNPIRTASSSIIRRQVSKTPSVKSSSCTEYHPYPWPEHHSGLPYLGDVFASHDAQWAFFIAIDRGECKKDYEKSDKFTGHRFMCVFPDNVYVMTDYVHSVEAHGRGFVIRCRIPSQFQHLVKDPQQTTFLHVDLHAMDDLELQPIDPDNMRQYPSVVLTETPRLAGLPVCHPVPKPMTQNQYNLTAFTRIKSNYTLDHRLPKNGQKVTVVSSVSRMMEWIEYHQQQGFDHFVIYDNDPSPHGPIENLLAPLVESGLVTYRWFPMGDCWREYGDIGRLSPSGQVAGSLAALHRMSMATKFFAHMDVDEFFVPLLSNETTVLDMVAESDSSVDAFVWKPTLMAPCSGTEVNAEQSVLSKWRCLTDEHLSDIKLIMRANRMLYFMIHFPVVTVNGTRPKVYNFNDKTEGFLAHYRDRLGSRYWKATFSGMVRNNFTNDVTFMDHFLRTREEKLLSENGMNMGRKSTEGD